jgi:hypothetical protein
MRSQRRRSRRDRRRYCVPAAVEQDRRDRTAWVGSRARGDAVSAVGPVVQL